MFEWIIRKPVIKRAQKYIEKLEPKVNIHIPKEIPLPSVKIIKQASIVASQVKALEEDIKKLSDEELRNKTQEFKSQYFEAIKSSKDTIRELKKGYAEDLDNDGRQELDIKVEGAQESYLKVKQKALESIQVEAFAVVREASIRVLGMRHYDIQVAAGAILNDGNITEMTTGEGKTLVATLPAYLNALTEEGVHVVTVNDYLAKRDKEWMGPIYEFLGLTTGVILHDMVPTERQAAYGSDITYGTNNEFGFDYLRDNMVNFKEDMAQRPHHYAIVDEVDSILVDEARTPLIISGPADEATDKYYRANEIAKKLKGRMITEKDEVDAKYQEIDLADGYDFLANEKSKSISLTDQGEERAAEMFGIDNLHDMSTIEYRHHILQALKAYQFFMHDVDYVIRDGQVIIVDEFTGRMMPGRRWSDGLHQAVEAKEGIKIERENQTLATITFQNYFRLYEKLAGMTGTAYTEASEFKQIYSLETVVIPTNKVLQRKNYADCIYKTVKEKYDAVVDEVEEFHKRGQPVLVGTITIEKSEVLSTMLAQRGIQHKVLNAKYHEMEAHIIAQAGRYGSVTIATNMAGRGTDIMLGGNPEHLTQSLAEEQGESEADGTTREKFLAKFREECSEEHKKVVAAGGLHVLGTERHESRRIDNQLRGRQGRQGDPGSSRFYVSLEDDLMRLFASDRIMGMMDALGMEEGQVLEHPWLSSAIETAQRRVEGHNFEIRKHLIDYDNVMNRQREVIYDYRRDVLESDDVKYMIEDSIKELSAGIVFDYLFMDRGDDHWDMEGLDVYLKTKFHLDLGVDKEKFVDMQQDEIQDFICERLMGKYAIKEQEVGSDRLRHLERILMLHTIDSKWKDHLYAMDQLREGVGLRSFAQRDPLIEYKREGFSMFQTMYDSISEEVAETIFRLQPAEKQERFKSVFGSLPQEFVHSEASGISDTMMKKPSHSLPIEGGRAQSPKPIQKSGPKVGRNDPCPCGSGKKYKKCCAK